MRAAVAIVAIASCKKDVPPGHDAGAAPACAAGDLWKLRRADATFAWTDRPALDQVPAEGVRASVGGDAFEVGAVEIYTFGAKGYWELRALEGCVGVVLTFAGKPQVGVTRDDADDAGRDFFRVPPVGATEACLEQTVTMTGAHARVARVTALDGSRGTVDVAFATTWRTPSGRETWAAGTVRGARFIEYP